MNNGSGKVGEDCAAAYLQRHGYTVLERNYHSRYGEIDIIAENEEYIAFVEVKTRELGGLLDPFEAITPQKQKKLILTAQQYLSSHEVTRQPRFDAAAVYTRRGTITEVKYLENAFELN